MPEQQKSKHTPGPWKKYGRVDAGGNFTVAGENPRVGTIATIPKQRQRSAYYDARSPEEMEAIAFLIAAAPELLDGCNALIGLIQLISDNPDVPQFVKDLLNGSHRKEEAIAAIAKAKGRP